MVSKFKENIELFERQLQEARLKSDMALTDMELNALKKLANRYDTSFDTEGDASVELYVKGNKDAEVYYYISKQKNKDVGFFIITKTTEEDRDETTVDVFRGSIWGQALKALEKDLK